MVDNGQLNSIFAMYLGYISSYSLNCAVGWPNWRKIIRIVDQIMVLMSFCKHRLRACWTVQVSELCVCLLCEDHFPIASGTNLGNIGRYNSLHWRRSMRVYGNGKIFIKYGQKFSMAASSTGNVPGDNDK